MVLAIGTSAQVETTVTKEMTAREVGSGSLLVLATPCMCALMEKAACSCIASALEEGTTTVGTQLEITHDAATPVGMCVRADATVTAVDGRKITFSVRAFDEKGQIGAGIHTRVVVQEERFLQKTYDKL